MEIIENIITLKLTRQIKKHSNSMNVIYNSIPCLFCTSRKVIGKCSKVFKTSSVHVDLKPQGRISKISLKCQTANKGFVILSKGVKQAGKT